MNHINDKELFRRTKYASWKIMQDKHNDGETYAYHVRCPIVKAKKLRMTDCSWYISDNYNNDTEPVCYACGYDVPDYIQALIRLYEGR